MLLVLDLGNTDTVMGLFEAGDLLDHWRFGTRPDRSVDEVGLLVRALIRESGFSVDSIRSAVIASVVPQSTQVFVETCQKHLGVRTTIVDASTPLPIRLDVDEPLTVGADRIVNTLAAAQIYRKDTIAVDLGTATTFDCITADGVFLGGVIAPGVLSSAETLVQRTAKLPRVDLERPERVIGRRSESCMRSGIFFSATHSIDGIVQRIKDEWKRPDAFVVATGGLASLIGPHCRSVDLIEPFLSLLGLELVSRHLETTASGARITPLKRPQMRRRSS